MENLKYTFDQVNDWIKTADQKALILGSLNVIGFIYQIISVNKLQCDDTYAIVLFTLSIISTACTLFFWLRIIYPRLDNKHKKSKIYFLHLANAYENDIDSGISDLQHIKEDDFKRDLASQIVINSIIAKKKYYNIQNFIWVFAFQIVVLILLIIKISI